MTDEYTPTTERVRSAFTHGYAIDDQSAVFDRWLKKHDAGVKAEAAREVAAEIRRGVSPTHPNVAYRDGFVRSALIADECADRWADRIEAGR